MKLGTSNCVNYSIWNPKHSAKHVYHTGGVGIVYCTCGHFLRNGTEENKKFVQYTVDLLSILSYYIKKGRPPRAPLWEEARGSRVLHREFAQEEMQEEVLLGYPRPVHPRREVPQEPCLTSVALKKCVVRWTKLADEDHAHHITPEEIRVYRNNWWIRSNTVGSDTMPVRHRPDFKQGIVNLATAQR